MMNKNQKIFIGIAVAVVVLFVLKQKGMLKMPSKLVASSQEPEVTDFDPRVVKGKDYTSGELMQEQVSEWSAGSPDNNNFFGTASSRRPIYNL